MLYNVPTCAHIEKNGEEKWENIWKHCVATYGALYSTIWLANSLTLILKVFIDLLSLLYLF